MKNINVWKWTSILLIIGMMIVCFKMPSIHRVLDGETNDSIERIDTIQIQGDSLSIDSIFVKA